MKRNLYTFLCYCIMLLLPSITFGKERILVSTDIGGTDADDNQSMLHLLMYSDIFDIEGLVSSPSFGNGSKEEIHRMIDIYAEDYPVLIQHYRGLMTPDSLKTLCFQGRHGLAPWKGFDTPTEGSQRIVDCARRDDSRPLYVLVWGSLEDVAQALHDAPDIAGKLRVYWIGGPNKKWGANAYAYIAENFPDLWMIENNASYRGFITKNRNSDCFNTGFYQYALDGAGNIGADFINYYNGVVKMGDTPSLLYMMNGTPSDPESDSWGGSFEKTTHSSRRVINPGSTDSVPVYSIIEFRFSGPRQNLPEGERCFTLSIDGQDWKGEYLGNGEYGIRFAPKQTATLPYRITYDNDASAPIEGTLVVDNTWPGTMHHDDYLLGENWWTDRSDPALYDDKWQGAKTVGNHRNEVLQNWAIRLSSLKTPL